jgi:GMP synthase PP-ATPase subunit
VLEVSFWFSSKITHAIEKKFQLVIHHHQNMAKSTQHHWLAPGTLPHNVLDEILNHNLTVAKKHNLGAFPTMPLTSSK